MINPNLTDTRGICQMIDELKELVEQKDYLLNNGYKAFCQQYPDVVAAHVKQVFGGVA